ncbi:flagellar hook-length control protein FliK [Bacteriovoracaceae bacterium]|nr:flagellar hook-length control protein FliK [Bacteriovoracaceae bacterium]
MIKNDSLLNILAKQQQSFDNKISSDNALVVAEGQINSELNNEFMGELQKQMNSDEQATLFEANPEVIMEEVQNLKKSEASNNNNTDVKNILEQLNADPKLSQNILQSLNTEGRVVQVQGQPLTSTGLMQNIDQQLAGAELGGQPTLNAQLSQMQAANTNKQSALEATTQQLNSEKPTAQVLTAEAQVLEPKLLAKLSTAEAQALEPKLLAKLSTETPSSEDFVNTLNMQKQMKPKLEGLKNAKAKYFTENELKSDNIIKFNRNVNPLVQEAKSKDLLVKAISGAEAEANKFADMLVLNNESSVGMNSSFKAQPASLNVNTESKVFDMGQIADADVASPNQLISKISDYIIQSKVANEPKVELTMNHHELGKVDIMVEKSGQNTINVAITSQSAEGQNFFKLNQADLLSTLAKSGINISEFKLDASNSSGNNSNQSNSQSGQFSSHGQSGQHQSKRGEQDAESQRREELWEMFNNRDVA